MTAARSRSERWLRSTAIPFFLALACVSGCRGRARDGAGDRPADGGVDGEAALATAVDAAPPPDESIPPTASEELSTRAKHLLEAIAHDDPGLATDIVFPRDGWVATRDAVDPGKEWEKRVAGPFRRAIHALSRRHADFERAQFVSLEMGRSMEQARLQRRSWKKALWQVRESRITFMVDGRTRTLPIRELTGWRGAWYLTRLR
jgi:hypothetical protein